MTIGSPIWHHWMIGHEIYAAELVIVSSRPATPGHYRSLIPAHLNVVHATMKSMSATDHEAAWLNRAPGPGHIQRQILNHVFLATHRAGAGPVPPGYPGKRGCILGAALANSRNDARPRRIPG